MRNQSRSLRKRPRWKEEDSHQEIAISKVNKDNVSYAEITRKLKDGIDLDTLDVKVTELRRINRGAISMTVGKGVEGVLAAEKLKVAVEAVLGPRAGVRL